MYIIWDMMVADMFTGSYISLTSAFAGSVIKGTASIKLTCPLLAPLAFETLSPVFESGTFFLDELGGRLISVTSDPRERSFLYQRLSMRYS